MAATKEFRVDALSVKVFATQADLAAAAAREAQACIRAALEVAPSTAAILATGNSQLQFLAAWTKLATDWQKLTLFHMDEYLGIDAAHPASFRKYMRERVEATVHPRAFHYMEGDALEPLKECERYERLLRAQPIALCCLGVGENGHLAFNDPPVADFGDPRWLKIVKLDEACRRQQAGEGHFPNVDAVPQYALTLTIPALCAAKRMLCIVPEKRKARAVRDALNGPISTACPASFLRRQAHATLFLDAESACEIVGR